MSIVSHDSPDRNIPPSEQNAGMTSRERTELAALARLRAKVAKTAARERHAALNPEIEAQLSAEFSAEDKLWADVTLAAQKEIAKADAEIARRCDEIGVPKAFRPSLHLSWHGRGANADSRRRNELRVLARARNDSMLKSADAVIERASLGHQERIMLGGLTTDAARAMLESMPSVDELLPSLTVAQVKELLPTGERTSAQKRADLLAYGGWSPPALPEEARS